MALSLAIPVAVLVGSVVGVAAAHWCEHRDTANDDSDDEPECANHHWGDWQSVERFDADVTKRWEYEGEEYISKHSIRDELIVSGKMGPHASKQIEATRKYVVKVRQKEIRWCEHDGCSEKDTKMRTVVYEDTFAEKDMEVRV